MSCVLAACGSSEGAPEQDEGHANAGAGGAGTGGVGGRAGAGGAPTGVDPVASDGGLVAGDTLPLQSVVAFHTGTCAIGNSGRLACWGVVPDDPTPWSVPTGSFAAVVQGGGSICAQRDTGDFACFMAQGQSGTPTLPPPGTVLFSSGRRIQCGLDANGVATCVGAGAVQPPPGERFSTVDGGATFACGIRSSDGSILCWGSSGSTGTCAFAPQVGQLEAPAGRFTRLSVATDGHHSCAIRVDGTIACWGAGEADADRTFLFCDERVHFGQSVPPPGEYTDVSAGNLHTCAVGVDGTVTCWGAGTRLGDCAADLDACGQAMPPADSGFVQVASGYTHSCAARADRTVACWGSNTGGRSTPPPDFP